MKSPSRLAIVFALVAFCSSAWLLVLAAPVARNASSPIEAAVENAQYQYSLNKQPTPAVVTEPAPAASAEKEEYESEYSVVEDNDDNEDNLSFLEQEDDLEADQPAAKSGSARKASAIRSRDSSSVKRPEERATKTTRSAATTTTTTTAKPNAAAVEYVIDGVEGQTDENGEEDYYQLSNKDVITKPEVKAPSTSELPKTTTTVAAPVEVTTTPLPSTTTTTTHTTTVPTVSTTTTTTTSTIAATNTKTTTSTPTSTTTKTTTKPTSASSVLEKMAASDAKERHYEDEEYDEDPLVDRQVSASSSATTPTQAPAVVKEAARARGHSQEGAVRLNKQNKGAKSEQQDVFNPHELNLPGGRQEQPISKARGKDAENDYEDENLEDVNDEDEYEDDMYTGDEESDLDGDDAEYEEDDNLGPDLKNGEDYEEDEGGLAASPHSSIVGRNRTAVQPEPLQPVEKDEDDELIGLEDEYKDDDKLTIRTTTVIAETASSSTTTTPSTAQPTVDRLPTKASSTVHDVLSEDEGDEELDEADETEIEDLDLTEVDDKGLSDETDESEELATTSTRRSEATATTTTTSKYVLVDDDDVAATAAPKIVTESTIKGLNDAAESTLPSLEVEDLEQDEQTQSVDPASSANDVSPGESDDYHVNYKGENDLEINYFKLTKGGSRTGAGARNRTSLLDAATLKELIKSPALLAGIFGGILVGIVTAFVLLFFIIYRMRRRRFDENTYIINGTIKGGSKKKSGSGSGANGGVAHPYANGHYRSNANQHVTLLSSSSISPVIAANSSGSSSSSSTSSTTGSTSVTTALLNSGGSASSSGSGTTNSRLLKYGNAGNTNSLKKSDMALSINHEGTYNYAYMKAPTKEFYA